MKYTLALALALAHAQSAIGLTVDTPPSLVQCQPVLFTWREGTAPYFPSVIPGGQPSATPLKSFDKTTAQSLTWTVDVPAGTRITVELKDSTGITAFTDELLIQPSSDSSCLSSSGAQAPNGAPAPNAAPAPAASSTTAANGTPAVATSTAGTAAASGGSATTSGPPAASPSARPTGTRAAAVSATATSGAVRGSVAYGLAGVLAAVGAALF